MGKQRRMPTKRFVVLANSIKKDGRCVAGREMPGEDGAFGPWCRPISSDRPEGELFPQHMPLKSGTLSPLVVVDVPLSGYAKNPAHPEDWYVSGEQWEIADTLNRDELVDLIEEPPNLWLEKGQRSDRVSTAFIEKLEEHQSIYLIRPDALRIRYGREYNPFKGHNQKKSRVLFNYQGAAYDLSLTDPIASATYCKDFPDVDEPAKEIALENSAICVSLTPPFKGFHYKVVATILEMP